jgi:hypothetical protein
MTRTKLIIAYARDQYRLHVDVPMHIHLRVYAFDSLKYLLKIPLRDPLAHPVVLLMIKYHLQTDRAQPVLHPINRHDYFFAPCLHLN